MQRGEVWWAEFPLPAGRRPVLLISRNDAYDIRTEITVAQITRTIRNIPVEVGLGAEDGMPEICVVNLDTITTVSKARLGRQITTLPEDKMRAVDAAIKYALALE
jgi:mRNA interferase MazF